MSRKMIPTVGRVIYIRLEGVNDKPENAPFAGLITAVNDDDTINTAGWNATGHSIVANSSPLVDACGKWPIAGSFCHWMDYQIQAQEKAAVNAEKKEAAAEEIAADQEKK